MYFTVLSLHDESDENGNEPQPTISFSHTTLDSVFANIKQSMRTLPSDTKVTDIHIKVVE